MMWRFSEVPCEALWSRDVFHLELVVGRRFERDGCGWWGGSRCGAGDWTPRQPWAGQSSILPR